MAGPQMPSEPDTIEQAMKDPDLNVELNADDLQVKVDNKTIYLWIGEVAGIFFDMVSEKYPRAVQSSIKLNDHEKELVSLGLSPLVDAVIQKLGLTADEILAVGVMAMVFLPRAAIMIRYLSKKDKKVKKDDEKVKTE